MGNEVAYHWPVRMLSAPHHYPHLVRRWRALARTAGVRLQRFAQAGAAPLFFLKTPALAATGGIYISAGIHGDEPASSEALICPECSCKAL